VIVAAHALEFLLVAGLTAVVVFTAGSLVLWLMRAARRRRQASEAMPPEAGRAQLGD
jgi:hypothetical protein